MIKTIFFIIFILTLQLFTTGGDTKYLFYSISKEVHRVTKGKKEKALRGMFLSPDQSIILAQSAEIMLVQNDGKSLLLNKAGTYTFKQITRLFVSAKSGGMSKFFSYMFEKFLDNEDEDQQKVAAAVFRGKRSMLLPADSNFLFAFPITLKWKPEQKNIPYKINCWINGQLYDTVMKNTSAFSLPSSYFEKNKATLIKWNAYPSDSKVAPSPFVYLIPGTIDASSIKKDLKKIIINYANNKQLQQQMKTDLLLMWINKYDLR